MATENKNNRERKERKRLTQCKKEWRLGEKKTGRYRKSWNRKQDKEFYKRITKQKKVTKQQTKSFNDSNGKVENNK